MRNHLGVCYKCKNPIEKHRRGQSYCQVCMNEYAKKSRELTKLPVMTIKKINENKHKKSLLTAIKFTKMIRHPTQRGFKKYILCKCLCGGKKELPMYELISGSTISCGCLAKKKRVKYRNNIKAINDCYNNMIGRCYNLKNKGYRYYGAIGVVVCDEWKNNYQSFLNWARKRWKKGYQLDKDLSGNGRLYSPTTCQFVPRLVNLHAKGKLKRDASGKFLKRAA